VFVCIFAVANRNVVLLMTNVGKRRKLLAWFTIMLEHSGSDIQIPLAIAIWNRGRLPGRISSPFS